MRGLSRLREAERWAVERAIAARRTAEVLRDRALAEGTDEAWAQYYWALKRAEARWALALAARADLEEAVDEAAAEFDPVWDG